ncbi:hypothetical protein QTG56_02515 [Rossellomorea sp. AcN35-11]|nr:hypothetical protein [Rossellomorea aquimaris]WJV30050.1 hypothetical protein QTG56_02515 [Rossellomorea sp. AcN35-11]
MTGKAADLGSAASFNVMGSGEFGGKWMRLLGFGVVLVGVAVVAIGFINRFSDCKFYLSTLFTSTLLCFYTPDASTYRPFLSPHVQTNKKNTAPKDAVLLSLL